MQLSIHLRTGCPSAAVYLSAAFRMLDVHLQLTIHLHLSIRMLDVHLQLTIHLQQSIRMMNVDMQLTIHLQLSIYLHAGCSSDWKTAFFCK